MKERAGRLKPPNGSPTALLSRRLLDEQWDAEGVSAAEHAVDGATAKDIRWGAFWAAANATEAVVARELARTKPPFPLKPDEIRKWAETHFEVKEQSERTERASQANILRDIFGNPFHAAEFDPTWRTHTTLRLAQAIYEDRSFDRMSDLADDLQRAGCQDLGLLDHCRKAREHAAVAGPSTLCWGRINGYPVLSVCAAARPMALSPHLLASTVSE